VLHLAVIQARFGDCLVLEHRRGQRVHRYLIDGGPSNTYAQHLRPYLDAVAAEGRGLDAVVLSHVDTDHAIGLLDFLTDVAASPPAGTPPVPIGEVWHNSFALVPHDPAVDNRVKAALQTAGASMVSLNASVLGVDHGNQLRIRALQLGLPLNQPFPAGEILIDTAPTFERDGAQFRVVGPSKANLDALRRDWLAWLEEHENDLGDPNVAATADDSVPNLSSVCLLASANGRSVLLTGDAVGDHIVTNLEQLGMLAPGGTLHVNLLKMPHHGSDRNVTPAFFDRITADRYVFSADGLHGNPDMATLIWLAEALKRQGRTATIYATNRTESLERLKSLYPASTFGYRLRFLQPGRHFMRIPVD
jgi:hypothetical protein